MAEPTQVEVLAWMERTGGTPADAVGHFWPDAEPGERAKRRNTVKQWAYRARSSSPATTTRAAAPLLNDNYNSPATTTTSPRLTAP